MLLQIIKKHFSNIEKVKTDICIIGKYFLLEFIT